MPLAVWADSPDVPNQVCVNARLRGAKMHPASPDSETYGQGGWDVGIHFNNLTHLADQLTMLQSQTPGHMCDSPRSSWSCNGPQWSCPADGKVTRLAINAHGVAGTLYTGGVPSAELVGPGPGKGETGDIGRKYSQHKGRLGAHLQRDGPECDHLADGLHRRPGQLGNSIAQGPGRRLASTDDCRLRDHRPAASVRHDPRNRDLDEAALYGARDAGHVRHEPAGGRVGPTVAPEKVVQAGPDALGLRDVTWRQGHRKRRHHEGTLRILRVGRVNCSVSMPTARERLRQRPPAGRGYRRHGALVGNGSIEFTS
jgi:hypothetical protein